MTHPSLQDLQEYTHQPLNREVRSISGGYILEKEERIQLGGRELFYAVGTGIMDTACCGMGGGRYALVVGYVEKWQARTDEQGCKVSLVSRVRGQVERDAADQAIRNRETGLWVQFL